MLKATFDNVILKALYQDTAENSTLIIPDTYKKRLAAYVGEVVSVGPNHYYGLKPGDRILFPRGEGIPVMFKDQEYLSLQEKWVLAKLEDTNEKS